MIDLIREYLTSVGFEVDKKSFDEANKKLQSFERAVNSAVKAFAEDAKIKKFSATVTATLDKAKGTITKFLTTTGGRIVTLVGGITAAMAALWATINVGLYKFSANMAKADLQIQLFARRMHTTVANARSLKAVMEAMGLQDMEQLKDVAMNPELRAQFMTLRNLSADMGLDEDAQKGLENIRAIGYEFQKLNLMMGYFWQKLAGYLGHFNAGALADLKNTIGALTQNAGKGLDRLAYNLAEVWGIVNKFVGVLGKLAILASPILTLITKLSGVDTSKLKLPTMLDALEAVLDVVNALLDGLNALLDFALKPIKFDVGAAAGAAGSIAANPLAALGYYTRRIYDFLVQAWNTISGLLRKLKMGFSEGLKTAGNVADFGTKAAPWLFNPLGTAGGAAAQSLMKTLFGGSNIKLKPNVQLSQDTSSMLKQLEKVYQGALTVTSGMDGHHTKNSAHYKGLGLDLVPSDTSPEGWAGLAEALLKLDSLSKLNLELRPEKAAATMSLLRNRGADMSRVQNILTPQTTGDHIHATGKPMEVTINVHGVTDPERVAQIAADKIRQLHAQSVVAFQGVNA